MATTQKTPATRGRKPAAAKANPNIAAETLKAVDEGTLNLKPTAELPEAPRSEEAKHDKRFLAVSEGSCLMAMQQAFGFDKAVIHLECAVALTVFAFSEGGANREATNHMKEIYQQAGYDVSTDGEDYKTVMRRIGAFAKLYNSMDRREIIGAMDGRTEMDAIDSLKNYLTTEYNFKGLNAILAAAGKPVKQTNTPEYRESKQAASAAPAEPQASGTPADQATAAKLGERISNRRADDAGEDRRNRRETDNRPAFLRRASDEANAIVFKTEHMHVAIPRGISREEVQELALRLMTFAATMDFDAESDKGAIPMQGEKRQVAHAGDRRH